MRQLIFLTLLISLNAHALVAITSGPESGRVFSSYDHLKSTYLGTCLSVSKGYVKGIKVSGFSYSSTTVGFSGTSYKDSDCSTWYNSHDSIQYSANFSYTCPADTVYDSESQSCLSQCELLQGNESAHNWDYFQLGDNPLFCSSSCELKAINTRVCLRATGRCSGNVVVTGNSCEGDSIPGGNIPDEVPQGCEEKNGVYLCSGDSSGDGKPDAGEPLDPDAKCGYNAYDKFVCSGGSYGTPDHEMKDPTKPLEGVESSPINPSDVNQREGAQVGSPTNEADTQQQIKKLNEHINTLLTSLNSDNNANFKDVIDELKNSNQLNDEQLKQLVAGTNKQLEIWGELKELQIQSTNEIVTAVSKVNQYEEFYHNQAMLKQNEIIQSLRELSENIGSSDSLDSIFDAITNTDGTIDSTGTTYTSQHTTESLSTEMVTRIGATRDAIYDGMLSAFSDIDLSNAAKPSFALDMSGFGFGSYDLADYINLDYVFGFIRICILFTAALTCRKLIFGG